ncbi:hypothetical protein LTR37_004831 [Vermiconidia calcicola]|uniref:Uncharacterized protein n=1 Tax=Vermiconidia calcicola TaxID=1690605 RepID=A0ACC3NLK7_9PEZI|nr:hypothetical protein LTR37_004831 [Vermiconidia calcicola]
MSQEVHIIAILYPKPDKVERLRELMGKMCKDVHGKEDYTLRYMMTEQLDADTPDVVMIETYKDKSSADKHGTEPHFKELFATFDSEGMFSKPPYLAKTISRAGFDADRKLI